MRRKGLTLHHGLLRSDPVAAFGLTFSPEETGTDKWRIENVLESFVPRVWRVRAQGRQVLRRMARFRKAKTKARRWWLTRYIRADIKQRERAMKSLVLKWNRWRHGFFGKQIRSAEKVRKLRDTLVKLEYDGRWLQYRAEKLMHSKGTLERMPRRPPTPKIVRS